MSFYDELKRRNVIRVGIAYIVAAWLIIQVTETIFPLFGYGDTPARIVVIVLAIGFPLFLLFSWVFEFTPEGLKRETDVDLSATATRESGKQLDRIIIVLLALGLGYFAFDKFVLNPARDAQLVEETTRQARSDALVESYGSQSIAVLPFVNMSDDADNEYFSDGISEEILNLLTKIPNLRVVSRSSAFSFKGKDLQIPEIAKALNVAHVLEGSVRKSGSQVRITAQLIEAGTDTHLWSETYDRAVLDVFAVQDEIAGKIGKQLELTLANSRPSVRPTESEEAYENYLRGLHFINQGVALETHMKAKDYFKKAIEIDPAYAQAHALLAVTYINLGTFRHLAPADMQQPARDAIMAAIELDSRVPEAWVAKGWLTIIYDFDSRSAEKHFRRVIELVPGSYMGYLGLAMALQMAGRYDEALASAQRAHQYAPLDYWARNMLAEITFYRREYDDWFKHVNVLNEMEPDAPGYMSFLGFYYALKNMPEEALRNTDKAMELTTGDPDFELWVAVVYAMLGKTSEAKAILARAEAKSDLQFVSPGAIAVVYANLGDNDQAFAWLERAVSAYDSYVVCLGYPVFDPIRSDPRFIKLCDDLQMACAEMPALGETR
jgi:TolB-like protein/Flp pilus assembly protein TadD